MRLATKLHHSRVLHRTVFRGSLVMFCALSADLSAQATAAPGLIVGQRVRLVTISESDPMIGTLIARRSDSLVIGRGRDTIAVGRSSVTRMELSLGTRHELKKAMRTGVVVGASLGAIASAATWKPCQETAFESCLFSSENRGDAAVVGGVIGVVPGLLIGLIAGLAIGTERWVPVSVASATQLRVFPRPGRIDAQFSFSFH